MIILRIEMALMMIIIATAIIVVRSNPTEPIRTFKQFKETFGKSYANSFEETRAMKNFYESLAFVLRTNGTAINAHSDMSTEEFGRFFTMSERQMKSIQEDYSLIACRFNQTHFQSEIDLRKCGFVTPVKDQKKCGACWAFSTVCTTESLYLSSRQVSPWKFGLSEQELVDCASPHGCDGDKMSVGFGYIEHKGVGLSDQYPYIARVQPCQHCFGPKFRIGGYCIIYPPDKTKIKVAMTVVQSAVSAVLLIEDLASFKHYDGKSVISSESKRSKTYGHGVNIVGYGSKYGQEVWIVRNSWGTTWGDKGYAYFAQNSTVMKLTTNVYMAWLH
ncbi:Sar s 1 allergen (cysteine protease-like protein 2) [Sarcoptes scabiei]|uniref:Sar s 1 allergen (Cysteine protease-like protein 2) n=1 Tax=Sarcoptes scabiei TaxID=52283 RepID=A0A132A3T2_SARSC|nr:Sar s 1 allergen (cysteine protease-like protein 2) [Sarcoptes scabiei]